MSRITTMHTECEQCDKCAAEAYSLARFSGSTEATCTMSTAPSQEITHSGTWSRVGDVVRA